MATPTSEQAERDKEAQKKLTQAKVPTMEAEVVPVSKPAVVKIRQFNIRYTYQVFESGNPSFELIFVESDAERVEALVSEILMGRTDGRANMTMQLKRMEVLA